MKKIFFILMFLLISVASYADKDTQMTLQLINEGKNDQAIEYIKSVLLTKKETADSYILIAIAYLEKEEYDLAKQNLNKALELQPKAIPAHYMLAMLYEKQQLWQDAIVKWENICKYTNNSSLKKLAKKHLKQLKDEKC